ncbi:MAG: trypsin-like peptidase domain-containing protein [Candidatus Dependentiae bacterium]|nr:trypsin-like peptidase domain-containing protein [Candidatus Dependentiae bacterium]
MHSYSKIGIAFGCIVGLVGTGGVVILSQRQRVLEEALSTMRDQKVALATCIDVPSRLCLSGPSGSASYAGQAPAPVEKMVSTSQVWRPIQDKVKDTVVQIFSQIAETDLLQPYKTPAQYSAYGSGFFINENGDIITNAHVVDQARSIWIQIPSLGKRIIDVEVVSVSPERDLALLRVKPDGLEVIRKTLGAVPYLPLGDSDIVRRSDEVMALGYPLGQQSVKSTTGVISGREQHLIQMSAAINPGNSGGPLVNTKGEVVGINAANVPSAQNVGYIIPINDLKIVLNDFYNVKLLRKPFLGVLFNNATDSLTQYLGNPQPGGCYVVEIVKGSTLDKAGIKRGDMIYEINGNRLDIFGEMSVAWSEDKVSIIDYVTRLSIGQDMKLVAYRNGTRKEATIKFTQGTMPAIHRIYPGYESIDYEVFGGMVVTPLTLNHIHMLAGSASGLAKFAELKNQNQQKLVITHIFPNSQLYRSRTLAVGATLNEINGMEVHTLEDFRKAVKKNVGTAYLTIRASDNVARASDNVFVTLPFDKVLEDESKLAMDYKYPLSAMAKDLCKIMDANKSVAIVCQKTESTEPEQATVA